MSEKLVIDVDGELVIYYDGVFKASEDMIKNIKRNAYLSVPVQLNPQSNPVISSLNESLANVAAAIISVYPERARIIEAPEEVLEILFPNFNVDGED